MSVEIGESDGRCLKTWKEIAAYFGCDERTVRRWEVERGLPVRRLPNGSRSAVFAYEGELKAWLRVDRNQADVPAEIPQTRDAQTQPIRRNALAMGAVLAGIVALAVAIGFWALRPLSLAPAGRGHVPNAEAERLYRAGLYAWQTRTPVGLTHAVDDFTQAIVHDPQYAQAYAGLASCYNLLREYTSMPASYAFPRAKAAAERAIALDPSLADAHASLAFIDFYWMHDAAAAEREYRRAIALSPDNATAHHWYANFLTNFGRFREALAEIETAQRIDTSSTSILADKGMILFDAGRTDEAIALLRQLEETEPRFSSPHFYLAMISRARGDDAAFVREYLTDASIRQDPVFRSIAEAASRGLAQGGHKGMLLALLNAQQQRLGQQEDSAYQLAMTYAQLGNTGQSIENLRISFRRHETDAISLNIEPLLRPLRRLPEFRALVRQAGLDGSSNRR